MVSVHDRTSSSTSISLIDRIRRGDGNAWQRFADIYAPLVYGWARSGGLQPNDAADITQEVFRTVSTKIDDFGRDREQPRFRGWLRAITRNQVRLHYRRGSSRPSAIGGSDAQQQLAEIPDVDLPEDESDAARERQVVLHRTLRVIRDDFEPATWQAFWGMVVEGLPAPELAESLGLTAVAVRQAKYRVLCRLREELDRF